MNKTKPVSISFFMKDAYALFNPSCSGIFGGAEVDLYLLARELAKKGTYRVTFLVGDFDQPSKETREDVSLVKLRYSNLNRYPGWLYKILRRIDIAKKLLADTSDIVMTKTASDTLGLIIFITKFLRRKRVVFKLGSDKDADIGYWKKRNFILYLLYKYSLPYADVIICQTDDQRALLGPRFSDKALIIRNGFPMERQPAGTEKDHILWVSRNDYMKRPELFAALARAVPHEKFLMVMPGSSQADKNLLHTVGETKNLTMLDHVPFSAMQDCFNRAKCFVNTSEFEGFPNTFIQAGLGTTPILSFRVNPDNIIDTFGLGCCCNDSLGRAADFITKLDKNRILFYGKNARAYVKKHHDIRHQLRLYEQVFAGPE